MSAAAYHCELAWLGGERAVANVLVEVRGDRIEKVTAGAIASEGAVRLSGLTLPGFANGHSHAFQRALRGATQTGSGSFWTWRDQMYARAATLNPDSYFALARATFGEMALAGVSCVGEFHYLHHGPGGRRYDDPNAMGSALIAAAREAGLRITLLDTCYLHGGIGTRPDGVQQRFSDGDVDSWARRADSLLRYESTAVRVGAAIHSVRAVDPDSIGAVAAWARAHSAPLHAHVSEQPNENSECVAAYRLTPSELLAERQALSRYFTAVHATHLTPADIRLLGTNGCIACFCPTTERDLADGIGPSVALREAGAELALGSDSHAAIDMLEEARALELNERLASRVRGNHTAQALLSAATSAGHKSLGWKDAGRIEAGFFADLVSVRLDSVRTAGTGAVHALENALFAATATDVHSVVTSGKAVARDGNHLRIDVPAELALHAGPSA